MSMEKPNLINFAASVNADGTVNAQYGCAVRKAAGNGSYVLTLDQPMAEGSPSASPPVPGSGSIVATLQDTTPAAASQGITVTDGDENAANLGKCKWVRTASAATLANIAFNILGLQING